MTQSGASRHLALDTSAYSQLRRGHETVLNWLAEAKRVELSITVLGELEAGFRLGQRYAENASTLSDFLDEPFVEVAHVSHKVAQRYGQLFAALRNAGTPIPTNDIWIAASAFETGAHLLTFDSDFARIPGLQHTLLKPQA